MSKYTVAMVGVVLAAGLFFARPYLFASPEKKITRQLAGLAGVITKRPQDGNFKVASQISAFGGYFTSDVTVDVRHPRGNTRATDRSELLNQFKGYKTYEAIHTLVVEWGTPVIHFTDENKKSATVSTTITASQNGTENWLSAPVKFTFIKEESGWKISSIKSP
jgi:hypothetical protein